MCVARNPHVVYVLRSTVDPSRYYTGLSTDVAARVAVDNAGGSTYTREPPEIRGERTRERIDNLRVCRPARRTSKLTDTRKSS